MYPKGDPQNPLTNAQLEDKFRNNASALLSPTEANAMVTEIAKLSDNADVSQLLKLLENRQPCEGTAPENAHL
jgi:2-methylcitrate dehydratase PrpD